MQFHHSQYIHIFFYQNHNCQCSTIKTQIFVLTNLKIRSMFAFVCNGQTRAYLHKVHVMHTVKNKSRNKCHLFKTQPLINHICMYIYLLDQQNVYLIGILEQTEAPKCTCVPTLNAIILKKSFLLSQRLFLWEALIWRNKECIEWKQRNRKLHGHIFLIAWLSFVYKK